MDKSNQILSDIIHHMKYAKYIKEIQRRESFNETCLRNMDMHIEKYPFLSEQIEQVYNRSVLTKKVLPAMRSMQFAGEAIKQNNVRMFNCSYAPCDDIKIFSEAMFLLLSGVGFGYSVQFHHVLKLPSINTPRDTKKYFVGDSIEGWAEAINELIKAFLDNELMPDFDFSGIRKKGSKLSSGGKAPGYYPLKNCLDHIKSLFLKKIENNDFRLSTLDCHSIFCFIADAVLSGGIRRAAMIALFSFDDIEMRNCKSSQWWIDNPHFARANNSAIAPYSEITKDMFRSFWQDVENSKAGEPGIIWTNNKEYGFNPCSEAALRAYSFCVSGDTKLITKEGISLIKDVVDKDIEIWNGENWSKVKPFKTGDSDRLHRVFFNDGSYLDATDNHKFLVKNRFEEKFKEVETLDLIKLLKTSKYGLQIPRSNIKYDIGLDRKDSYELGFFLGDGTINKQSGKASFEIFTKSGKDVVLKNLNATQSGKREVYFNSNGSEYRPFIFNDLDMKIAQELKSFDSLPSEIFTWSKTSILNFLSGWLDADGSNASKGVRLYSSKGRLQDAQLLLTKCGINSSLNLMFKKGRKSNLGIRKNDVWFLQITITKELNCLRLKCDNNNVANKGMYQIVKDIQTLKGKHESFCLNEPDLHQCVFNNVLTKQCNLVEINASAINNQNDFNQICADASFINTLQASYTNFHYLRDIWKQTTDEDALIGVSITGIASGCLDNLDLKLGSEIIKKTNEEVAKLIGINKAARCTLVKPAGTTSLILGTSSGIHDWHDKFYLRRVRVNKQEAIYSYILENLPEIVENDNFDQHTAIFVFPQKAPDNAKIRTNTDVIELLERIKKYNLEWIRNGHNRGDNYHNVSATISIKNDEWEKVGSWLWDNRYNYHGLSVLPFDGGTYQQAPFESCNKDIYKQYLSYFKDIDLKQVVEIEDNTEFDENIACSGGTCELI